MGPLVAQGIYYGMNPDPGAGDLIRVAVEKIIGEHEEGKRGLLVIRGRDAIGCLL